MTDNNPINQGVVLPAAAQANSPSCVAAQSAAGRFAPDAGAARKAEDRMPTSLDDLAPIADELAAIDIPKEILF